MTAAKRHPGSFRDPRGHIYVSGDNIYRTVTDAGAADYEMMKGSGLLADLTGPNSPTEKGMLLAADEVPTDTLSNAEPAKYLLQHPRIPFVSYPYEWSFAGLKAAALLQLNVYLAAMERGMTLSDASAYNVQFQGASPVFIDHLSFKAYQDGQLWAGHRQFCEQFLNPLLLTSLFGLRFNDWYRGQMEGIPATELAPLLKFRHKLNFKVLSHVVLQAKFQQSGAASNADSATDTAKSIKAAKLPKASYIGMLQGLRSWIDKLQPKGMDATTWADYNRQTSYTEDEAAEKEAFIRRFIAATKPDQHWDMGCNRGEYSEIALDAGAKYVVGFDQDEGALDAAFARARDRDLNFLPLFLDLTNPTPGQGWAEGERQGLAARGPADTLQALAVIHHLAIGRNVPLEAIADWFLSLAPQGVLEFVPKQDAQVKRLLALREDIFPDYTITVFRQILEQRARIVAEETISASGRTLFWYERAQNPS